MKNKSNIILVFIFLFCTLKVHCELLTNNFLLNINTIYEASRQELRKKHFNNAIAILETIRKNNITNINNDKIRIHLIYAYYKSSNLNMAKKNIEEFILFYPNHPNIDYVMYMACLVNMNLNNNNMLFKILPINNYKNDPNYIINSFFQLKDFISKYPASIYVINAKKTLIHLKNLLSEHDFQILKFYFSHKEYVAVINRGEEIIQKYPETPVARKTLIYMKKSFCALKIFDTAKKISQIIALNKV